MSEEQKKKIENRIMYLSFGVLGLAVLFLILVGVTGQAETMKYPIGLGVFLIVYWVISDILPIRWLKILENKTEEQKRAYWMFTLADAGGFAGLAYFLIDMDSLLGAIIFMGCTMLKRKFHDQYLGKTDAGETEIEQGSPETEIETEIEQGSPETETETEIEQGSPETETETEIEQGSPETEIKS